LPVWRAVEANFEKICDAVNRLPRTLAYTDFYFTNLAAARDGSRVLMFDYNYLCKSYVYSDIRNVCSGLGNEEARAAFLSAYGAFDRREIVVDGVASELASLMIACRRETFPNWANDSIAKMKDGRFAEALKKLLVNFDDK